MAKNAEVDRLLDELIRNCDSPDDLLGEKGLLKQLTAGLVERMLESEMSDHLGYEKHDPHGKNRALVHGSWLDIPERPGDPVYFVDQYSAEDSQMAARTKSKVSPKCKSKYRMKNWPTYDIALRNCGDITVWFDKESI